MSDTDSIHVISTSRDQVWLVAADSYDEAEDIVSEQYGEKDPYLYDEGTLDDAVAAVEKDGVELLNP